MSFPWLLTCCERFESITVEYTNLHGETKRLEKLNRSISELFQHELDHLDGILCIDHALDKQSVIAM
jgi:peptide deformylase